MADRNSSSTGSANRSLLWEKPFPRSTIKINVSEATSPAAAGIGKAQKFLAAAAAAHRGEAVETRQPERAADQIDRGDEPAELRMLHENARAARCDARETPGATPKETMSASESNSRPNGLSFPPMRATRPSSRSKMHASKIRNSALWMTWMKLSDIGIGLDDFGERHESRRTDFPPSTGSAENKSSACRLSPGGRVLGIVAMHVIQIEASTVSPPITLSPSFTLILACATGKRPRASRTGSG